MSSEVDRWRSCSSCKKPIAFSQPYWTCNVSTCNRKRTGLFFCSVSCWDAHLPIMRHREAWAEEQRSPSREAWAREQRAASGFAATGTPAGGTRPESSASRETSPAGSGGASRRTLVRPGVRPVADPPADPPEGADVPHEILIVASKLKAYVRARSGMNTSDSVMAALSGHIRALCDDAIREARQAERKTIMDRDFPKPGRR